RGYLLLIGRPAQHDIGVVRNGRPPSREDGDQLYTRWCVLNAGHKAGVGGSELLLFDRNGRDESERYVASLIVRITQVAQEVRGGLAIVDNTRLDLANKALNLGRGDAVGRQTCAAGGGEIGADKGVQARR